MTNQDDFFTEDTFFPVYDEEGSILSGDSEYDTLGDISLPPELELPLKPVFLVPKEFMIYAFPSGFRAVVKAIPVVYTLKEGRTFPRWKRVAKKFMSLKEAAVWARSYCTEVSLFKHKKSRNISLAARSLAKRRRAADVVDEWSEYKSDRNDFYAYAEVHHVMYVTEYFRARNVYSRVDTFEMNEMSGWFYKGMKKAATESSRSTPSWCMHGLGDERVEDSQTSPYS